MIRNSGGIIMSITSVVGRKFYNAAAITATSNYIYNASGGNNATSGLRAARADNVNIQFNVATLSATNLYIRIEGRTTGVDRWASIYTENVTAINTYDKIIQIGEKFSEVRVGAKVNNSATPNILYAGLTLVDEK
jgi:hypothetical protein